MFVIACSLPNVSVIEESLIRIFLSPRRKDAEFGIVVISTLGRNLSSILRVLSG